MKKKDEGKSNHITCRFTPTELELIKNKMIEGGYTNRSDYLRKMAIDGYVINVDFTEVKETVYSMTHAIDKVGVNINQITKRVNETGNIYKEDIIEIREGMEAIWQLLKSGLSNLLQTLR